MKLLFIAHKTFYPESSGGAQLSTLYLLKQLQKHGWDVRIICRTSPLSDKAWSKRIVNILPPMIEKDDILGFPCKRHLVFPKLPVLGSVIDKSWNGAIEKELTSYCPDVVLGDFLATDPLIKKIIHSGAVCIKFIRSLPVMGVPSIIPEGLHIIGNSPYSANVAQAITGLNHEYVLPFIDFKKYKTPRKRHEKITFINPTHQKGVGIATAVARRMPDRQFLFVAGKWAGFRKKTIEQLIGPARELPNIEIVENQKDMRPVYAETKVLLVPSQFIETFGRVIIEAQINGIPVVASDVGGIPFTVGKGGILVNPKDNVSGYVSALESLMQDECLYDKLSDMAGKNADRKEFDPEFQFDKFLNYLNQAVFKKPGFEDSDETGRCHALLEDLSN